jgi:NhaP-type Na+/H+ or K+/H+ antiporter
MTSDLSQLGFLLFVSALVAMLTRRLHLPYTVGLVLAGMALYFSHVYIKWHLTKDLIFSVLVFEAALFIHWRDFKKELPVVTLFATAGVVLAAAVTLAVYGSFFVAEHFHCSGVLAALTAGLVVGVHDLHVRRSFIGRVKAKAVLVVDPEY